MCEGDRKDEGKGKGDKSLVSQVVEDEERTKFDDVGNDVRQMEASAENHRCTANSGVAQASSRRTYVSRRVGC